MRPEIQQLAEWLEAQADSNPYGEFQVKVVLHAGKVTRGETGSVVKFKPTEFGGYDDGKRNR
ncbi:MAG: hypothetical protein K9M94_14835 [Spirochaetia bacterium]|nr:hypothetical protein [Spirochaetia bacterium]